MYDFYIEKEKYFHLMAPIISHLFNYCRKKASTANFRYDKRYCTLFSKDFHNTSSGTGATISILS